MADLSSFGLQNANEVEESGFNPLPIGEYKAIAVASEMKATKANDGFYLSVKFEIIDGQYKGRFIFTNFNLQNKSPDAVAIAKAELAAFCRAVAKPIVKDSAELHNIPILLKLAIKKSDEYGDQNVIKGYLPIGKETIPAESTESKPPWMDN